MKMQLTEFGVYIRKYRVDHGGSRNIKTKAIGISNCHLSNIEAGKRELSEPVINKLAKTYDLDIGYLRQFIGRNGISEEFQVVHTGNVSVNNKLVKLLRQKIDVMSDEDKQSIISILNK